MNKYQKITAAGVKNQIIAVLEADAALPVLNEIGMRALSDSPSETYGWLGQVPQMREWLGPRLIKELRESSYTLINRKFEASMSVASDDMRDDKTGSLQRRIQELAQRPNSHWIKLISELLTGYASYKCYDGKAFFATNHSEGDSGTIANLATSSNITTLDVTTAAAPTASEMIEIVLGAIAYFKTFKDDQGEPINENAKGFHFMAGTQPIYQALYKAINQKIVAGVVDNALSYGGFNLTCSMNPRLSALTTVVFGFRTDAPVKPFILQEREGIEIQTRDESSGYYTMNDACFFGLKARRAAGYGMYQYALHMTMS